MHQQQAPMAPSQHGTVDPVMHTRTLLQSMNALQLQSVFQSVGNLLQNRGHFVPDRLGETPVENGGAFVQMIGGTLCLFRVACVSKWLIRRRTIETFSARVRSGLVVHLPLMWNGGILGKKR